MKERMDILYNVRNSEQKYTIEGILFEHESQDQKVDIRLKNEMDENDEPKRKDFIKISFAIEVEDRIYELIESEENV